MFPFEVAGVGEAGDFGRQSLAMADLASARTFARHLLVALSFSTVMFFWMAAFARLSRDVTMRVAVWHWWWPGL